MKKSFHNMKVVIVDDDPIAQVTLGAQVERLGLNGIVASTGLEGLSCIRSTKPDICIVDWMLPGMNGLDLVRRLRDDPSTCDIYAIMLTAKGSQEELEEAFGAGVDDFLSKSPDIGEFKLRLRAAIRIIELQQKLRHHLDEVSELNEQLVDMNCRLQSLATTDELTKLSNRRDVIEKLQAFWEQWMRHHSPLCVAMVDIDNFKHINDQYGHKVGDAVLKHFSSLLKCDRRITEVVGRYGGEEFLIGMSQQSLDQALVSVERLRDQICRENFTIGNNTIPVTVSVGVAHAESGMMSLDDLIRAADGALYTAKHAGRNRVCIPKKTEAA